MSGSATKRATKLFEDENIRDKFLAHYEDLRGKVRSAIVRRHLESVALRGRSKAPRIIDVGCGDGRDALWLASNGYDVIAIDPAEAMLEEAKRHYSETTVRGSIEFYRGDAEFALTQFGPGSFDLVLSHGVAMYQDHPNDFVKTHLGLLRSSGMLSLLTKNADALAFRAVREATVDEALTLLDDSQGAGHLGVTTGAQTIQGIADIGFAAGATVRSWAGVRAFSDSPTDPVLKADSEKVIELEWRAALRDPYRRGAALLHVLLMRGMDLSLLPK
jgi:2-polyprenyl-3-methyl-5-hydroxy-6-metoxy-1,4-benzoquinol methylase